MLIFLFPPLNTQVTPAPSPALQQDQYGTHTGFMIQTLPANPTTKPTMPPPPPNAPPGEPQPAAVAPPPQHHPLPPFPLPSKWGAFAITFIIWTSVHGARKSYSVIKPVLIEDDWFGENKSQQTRTTHTTATLAYPDSFFFIFYGLSCFFFGKLADEGDPRIIMSISLLVAALLLVILGLGDAGGGVHNIAFFCVIWGLEASITALIWPGCIVVLGAWFPAQYRSRVMGWWVACSNIGNMMGGGLGSLAMRLSAEQGNNSTRWGSVFFVNAIPLIIVAAVAFFCLMPIPPPSMEAAEADGQGGDQKSSSIILKVEEDHAHLEEPLLQLPLSSSSSPPAAAASLPPPIGLKRALLVPGVLDVSFSFCLLKATTYAFFFSLPLFLSVSFDMDVQQANLHSLIFDLGNIIGAGLLGGLATRTARPMLIYFLAILVSALPIFLLSTPAAHGLNALWFLLMSIGFLLAGPQALLLTAVSCNLAESPGLKRNARAMGTVTSILDAFGSAGAAVMQVVVGHVTKCSTSTSTSTDVNDETSSSTTTTTSCNLDAVFYMLSAGAFIGGMCLARLAHLEMKESAAATARQRSTRA